jgi:hypothetical protein
VETNPTPPETPGQQEPGHYTRSILTVAIAPAQKTLFNSIEEDPGASQKHRKRVLRVVEPLVEHARKQLDETAAPMAALTFDLRLRIDGEVSLLQVTALSSHAFDETVVRQLSEAALAVADRLATAMAAIASSQPFVRSAATRGDTLFDHVAKVKQTGIRQDFGYAIHAGFVHDMATLKFSGVQSRAKSTWLQDEGTATKPFEAIIRTSRGGKHVTAAPLDGTPAMGIGVEPEGDAAEDLAAKVHLLCGPGSCCLTVETSTDRCKEAPEIERRVHRLKDVDVQDASQLENLKRLRDAIGQLLEKAEGFASASSRRISRDRRRGQVPEPRAPA